MRSLSALVLAALAVTLAAPPPARAQVYPISVDGEECLTTGCRKIRWVGSAVAIGRSVAGKEVLVTAGHCLGTVGRTNLGIVKPIKTTKAVTLRVGLGTEWRAATIGQQSSEADGDLGLILLTLQPGDTIRAVDVAAVNAPPGTPCTMAGYPNGGNFRQKLVRVERYRNDGVALVLDDVAIPGDSGGAVLNDQGELVGIVSSTDDERFVRPPKNSYATPAETIRRFVTSVGGGMPTANGVPLQPQPQPAPQQQFAPPVQPLPQLPPAVPQYTSDPVLSDKVDKLATIVEGAKLAGQIGTGLATGNFVAVILAFVGIARLIHRVRTGSSATGPPTTPPAQPGVVLPNGQLAGYAYTYPGPAPAQPPPVAVAPTYDPAFVAAVAQAMAAQTPRPTAAA